MPSLFAHSFNDTEGFAGAASDDAVGSQTASRLKKAVLSCLTLSQSSPPFQNQFGGLNALSHLALNLGESLLKLVQAT